MSITFAPAPGTVTGWKVGCLCPTVVAPVFGDRNDAVAFLAAWQAAPVALEGCDDESCLAYGLYVDAVEADPRPEVNVSNVNGGALLRALGLYADDASFEDVCCGAVSGQDFLGRVLVALAVAPADAGMPAHASATHSNFIDCGRSEGYLQDRLETLREIAEFAVSRSTEVTWA